MEKRKPVRKQTFIEEYKEKYPCMSKSTKGKSYAFCKVCRCDISVARGWSSSSSMGGGNNDIKRHIKKQKHKDNAEAETKAVGMNVEEVDIIYSDKI